MPQTPAPTTLDEKTRETAEAFGRLFQNATYSEKAVVLKTMLAATGQSIEDAGFDFFHSLLSACDFVGTVFSTSDITSAIADECEEREVTLTDAEVAEAVEHVQDSYEYTHLADRFAERGNEAIADLISEFLSVRTNG